MVIPECLREDICVVQPFRLWRQRSQLTWTLILFSWTFHWIIITSLPNRNAVVYNKKAISYERYRKALVSLCMAPHVGATNALEFLQFFGSKSGRVGGATAACNAGIPTDVWQAHGG